MHTTRIPGTLALLGFAMFAPLVAEAQASQASTASRSNEGKLPLGWTTRLDAGSSAHGGSDTLSFVQMTPGYHVTTGPAAIMWSPDSAATGTYTVEATIFLFPTKGREEGYGIFVGGQALDGAAQAYTYFLVRNDGKFLVKRREGATLTVLKDWTASPSIKRQAGDEDARNDLRIVVGGSSVVFSVNGAEVVSLPRGVVAPDGVFGIRMNHAVNAHVSKVARVR